jgi:hypothetical protein
MREVFETAEILACGWKLAYPEKPFPSREPYFSIALKAVRSKLPHGAALEFANTRIGERCLDAEPIVHCMLANLLCDGLIYTTGFLTITIDETTARILLRKRDITADRATDVAVRFQQATLEAIG